MNFVQWNDSLCYSPQPMQYSVLAYYLFEPIANPDEEVRLHKAFFQGRDVTGRIYLSHEGINGQMSGAHADAQAYMEWLHQRYPAVQFKIHEAAENSFPRMTVKHRPQLVALDASYDLTQGGERLSPHQWRQKLESGELHLLLDVRNAYEWAVGHFEGATLPALDTFRDFPRYAEELKQTLPADTQVMMYCTGGIRCEVYSAVLKEKGFQNVYQLEGGVINYGLQEGQAHWKGKLFVFDDRLAISIDGNTSEAISLCAHCHLSCDTYYNCANMDCNCLFIACPTCSEHYVGCCGHACTQAPRLRPFVRAGGNKPFRRKHLYSVEPSSSMTS